MVLSVVIAFLVVALVGAPIATALRDKTIYVSSLFSLRSLPSGDGLNLNADGASRPYSVVDTEIAYEIYTTVMAREKVRTNFNSKSDFILYVASFDPTLLNTLRAREVDPAEYDIDRSGWKDIEAEERLQWGDDKSSTDADATDDNQELASSDQ